MALTTIFTRSSPTLAGIEFDAVFEDILTASVETTGYTIESGARAADHRIIQPFEYEMTISVSNNPLSPSVTDFLAGGISNLVNLGGLLGLATGFLSGSDSTRAAATLGYLVDLMTTGAPFEIDAGDFALQNMIITSIERTKNPENENSLEAVVSMQEYPELSTLFSQTSDPRQGQLNDNDTSKFSASSLIDRGEQTIKDVTDKLSDAISGFFA